MKTKTIIKIAIILVVIIAISLSIKKYIDHVNDSNISISEVPFKEQIDDSINSIKSADDDIVKAHYVYRNTNDVIETQLKLDKINNDQSQRLLKSVFDTYIEGFKNISFTTFKESNWEMSKINMINSFSSELLNSGFCQTNSKSAEDLRKIQAIVGNYHRAWYVVKTSFSFRGIGSARTNISQSKRYRNDEYLSNCEQLNNALSEVPNNLYRAHLKAVKSKVGYVINHYTTYGSYQNFYNAYNEAKRLMNNFIAQAGIYGKSSRVASSNLSNISHNLDETAEGEEYAKRFYSNH